MATYANNIKSTQGDYIVPPTGQIEQQIKVLDIQNNKNSIAPEKYNKYDGYLKENGLFKINEKVRKNISYLHIDSSARQTEPYCVNDTSILLQSNPITSVNAINNIFLLQLKVNNNSYTSDDIISLSGLANPQTVLRTIYTDVQTNQLVRGVEVEVGQPYIKINCNPYIQLPVPISLSSIPSMQELAGSTLVTIKGIKTLGNFPINLVNTTKQIYLQKPSYITNIDGSKSITVDSSELTDLTYFYVIMDRDYDGIIDSDPINGYNFSVEFSHIGSVPINSINAQFPVSAAQKNDSKGYHHIITFSNNYITIQVPKYCYYTDGFGGQNICISKISVLHYGFTNPNNYIIPLNKTYYNIIKIELINTIFPKSAFVINSTNSYIFWQNLDDPGIQYSASISHGTYNAINLESTIEAALNSTLRYNSSKYNIFSVSINDDTDSVSFKSYNKTNLVRPIIDVSPDIIPVSNYIQTDYNFTITINHPSHNLISGDLIELSGFVSYLGILSSDLNKTFKITVINTNTYSILLNNINIIDPINSLNTQGGFSCLITSPNKFSLQFTENNTIGSVLGFNDVGTDIAITDYYSVITNDTAYINKPSNIHNQLKLSGTNYILMCCQELSNITHFGIKNIDNVFAKINMKCKTKHNDHDEYVETPMFFNTPYTLSKLSLSFYSPDGSLYDFNGLDHSFMLEITTLDELPLGVGIDAVSGREY